MTKKQLQQRIEELEARIIALEARPLYLTTYRPPWYSWATYGSTTTEKTPVSFTCTVT